MALRAMSPARSPVGHVFLALAFSGSASAFVQSGMPFATQRRQATSGVFSARRFYPQRWYRSSHTHQEGRSFFKLKYDSRERSSTFLTPSAASPRTLNLRGGNKILGNAGLQMSSTATAPPPAVEKFRKVAALSLPWVTWID